MSNDICCKKNFKLNEFATTIRVKSNDFGMKVIFHKSLKGCENREDIRFTFDGIKPNV